MKIVVLGASGQLGREFTRGLKGDILPLAREAGDLTKPGKLRQTLAAARPKFLVNCAAHTHVDQAESDPHAAWSVNTYGVRDLALMCRDLDCTLIHFSTNYVFGQPDQQRSSPYVENDPSGPLNVYGISKLAGESYVRSLCPRHFILRTCGLYGFSDGAARRGNFVETMLRKSSQGEPLRVVDDQVCTPTSTADLVRAVAQLLPTREYGLYHLTNAGACTWFEFACAIFAYLKRSVSLIPIRTEEYPVPAIRPRYGVLSNARWERQGFLPMRPWQEALEDHLSRRVG